MKFKYSAFIENTPEMREWLKSIGWKEKYVQDDSDIIVCASNTGMFSAIVKETQNWFESYSIECVDCRDNPDLFKAVTAIREDSDYMQWFYIEGLNDKEDWVISENDKFDWESDKLPFEVYAYSKCDLSELQEYFKSKQSHDTTN